MGENEKQRQTEREGEYAEEKEKKKQQQSLEYGVRMELEVAADCYSQQVEEALVDSQDPKLHRKDRPRGEVSMGQG